MKFLLPLFIIFTISFHPLMPLLDYAVNYQTIVEQKCVNRAKPELGCNGKCYLTKELAKTADNTPKQNNSSGNIFSFYSSIFLISEQYSLLLQNLNDSEEQNKVAFNSSHYHFFLHSKIFHPPLV